MNGNEHINFGIYSVTLLVAGFQAHSHFRLTFEQLELLELFVGVGVGTLLPDIDHKNSVLGRYSPIPPLHNVLKKIKIYAFKHGGITHTILINIWIFIIAYIYKSLLIAGIGIGYASHLYIDNLDGNKLNMLYWPLIINRKRK